MRKTLSVIFVFALVATAQDKKPAPLGDAYAKAALLAVKDLRKNLAVIDPQSDGARALHGKLDAADVEASTPDEIANSKALGNVAIDHTINALTLRAKALEYGGTGKSMLDDQVVKDILEREHTCFDAYEAALRERAPPPPPSCLEIVPPAKGKK